MRFATLFFALLALCVTGADVSFAQSVQKPFGAQVGLQSQAWPLVADSVGWSAQPQMMPYSVPLSWSQQDTTFSWTSYKDALEAARVDSHMLIFPEAAVDQRMVHKPKATLDVGIFVPELPRRKRQ